MYRRSLLAVVCISFFQFLSFSQDLTGIWRGYFVTEMGDEYKCELQVQQTGNAISGVSYSYLTTIFYGKATLTGNYNNTAKGALIREIKTVELRMSGFSQACIMKYMLQYEKSGKEETLEGSFTSKFEKDGFGVAKGDDCGGGKVFLRKVPTSDFYVEPFLRKKKPNQPVIVNQPPQKKDSIKTKVTVPTVKKPVTKPPVVKTNPKTTIPNTTVKQKPDSSKKTDPTITRTKPVKTIIPNPDVLIKRENSLIKTLVVNDPDVTVKLYDNGEIDGDTISVYLDKKLVLSAKRLSASPLIVKLKMDEDNSEHELVMVAENLGKIPPNTSLMIVESGDKRFDVRITSTEQKNAMVRFRYEKSKTSAD